MTTLATALMLETVQELLRPLGFTVARTPAVSGLESLPACYEVRNAQGALYTRCAGESELAQFLARRLAAHYATQCHAGLAYSR